MQRAIKDILTSADVVLSTNVGASSDGPIKQVNNHIAVYVHTCAYRGSTIFVYNWIVCTSTVLAKNCNTYLAYLLG